MEFELTTGTFESILDEKGRVVIPALMREYYTEKLVATQGLEDCVWIMTIPVYKRLVDSINSLEESLTCDQIEAFRYQHEAPARIVEIDSKTGRIPIPTALRNYANLSKECLVLSIDDHLEIWNEEDYIVFRNTKQKIAKKAKKIVGGKVNFFRKKEQE